MYKQLLDDDKMSQSRYTAGVMKLDFGGFQQRKRLSGFFFSCQNKFIFTSLVSQSLVFVPFNVQKMKMFYRVEGQIGEYKS